MKLPFFEWTRIDTNDSERSFGPATVLDYSVSADRRFGPPDPGMILQWLGRNYQDLPGNWSGLELFLKGL